MNTFPLVTSRRWHIAPSLRRLTYTRMITKMSCIWIWMLSTWRVFSRTCTKRLTELSIRKILRILLNFIHLFIRIKYFFRVSGLCSSSGILNSFEMQHFENWVCFCLQVRGGKHLLCWVKWLKLALSSGPKRVGVFLSSPEDGNRSSFRNVVLSSYLECRTIDKVINPMILGVIHHF
jgi:hypothetical protein